MKTVMLNIGTTRVAVPEEDAKRLFGLDARKVKKLQLRRTPYRRTPRKRKPKKPALEAGRKMTVQFADRLLLDTALTLARKALP